MDPTSLLTIYIYVTRHTKGTIWEHFGEIYFYTENQYTIFHLSFNTKMKEIFRKLVELQDFELYYPSGWNVISFKPNVINDVNISEERNLTGVIQIIIIN